jgi:hypothetical protein
MATNDTLPEQIKDGDDWFIGFASRLDPGNLPEKMLQASSNMRLQRGTATPRLGAQRLTQILNPWEETGPEFRAVGTYVRQSDGYEFMVAVCPSSLVLFNQDGSIFDQYDFKGTSNGQIVAGVAPYIPLGANVQILQALDRLYIFRGSSTNPVTPVTFNNAQISTNTWGVFNVENYPLIGGYPNRSYTRNASTVTVTLPAGNNFLQIWNESGAGFNQDVVIAGATDSALNGTTIRFTSVGINTVTFANPNGSTAPGTLSFMLASYVFNREFIVQSTHQPRFNGAYQPISPETTLPTGILRFAFFNSGANISAHNPGQTGMTVWEARSPLFWEYGVTQYVTPVQQISTTGTTANVPPADFGIYYQNRIVCKIGPQEIAASDILSDTFDLTLNNFRVNVGSGDSIVGFLPWIENQILVFMNRAIYVAYIETTVSVSQGGQYGAPGINSSITVITSEVGCLSRRSIVNAGQYVFFLSGKGVHMLTPQLDLKLIGNTMPLSEPIADFFNKLNYTVAYKACAAYYANRFYISVPWDNSTENNRVLVYNTLNQQWESIDSYPSTMSIDEFFIQSYGNQRRLFAGCRIWSGPYPNANPNENEDPRLSSGIALIDEVVGYDNFVLIFNPQNPFLLIIDPKYISSSLKTREYTFATISEKQFTRAQVQTVNANGDAVQIFTKLYDPDSSELIMDYTFAGGADSTLRPRIASRGSAIDLEIKITAGTPAIRAISVTGVVKDRQMISQE